MAEEAPKQSCYLLDLPWEDVLVPHVFCYFTLQQLVRLRRVSRDFYKIMQICLSKRKTFEISGTKTKISKEAFCYILKDNEVLQNLSLENCSHWLTDGDVLPVISQNHHLRRLVMAGCSKLTHHTLIAMALNCDHLQHVSLAHCEWVDNLSLRTFIHRCRDLLTLDLTACRQVDSDTICYLAMKHQNLKSVSLASNGNVTDESVEEMAKNCRNLERLDISSCLRVGNQAIRTLAEYCPKLRCLKVKHCSYVTDWSLEVLRQHNVLVDVDPPLPVGYYPDVMVMGPILNAQI
ncbi:F-box/LRR-repeat protein 15 [Thalassophryne amazonica]|uniref:F-box/LRR-repeat protein 15 n=1 Tax=Thalassophryne amazonica TaxID=390379 RepID=UPI00147092E0|nr:F-box/LRR-repeat protein 15 [Thalassophryne amazonica]XP_034050314.1 F-box/LRR-repeat protein 15 [Thalassophryne amazonica]